MIAPRMKRAVKSSRACASSANPANSSFSLRRTTGLQTLASKSLERLTWLDHAFSTRSGGESSLRDSYDHRKPPESVLNLGHTEWDSEGAVRRNRERFARSLCGEEMCLVPLSQIHSDLIRTVAELPDIPLKGDALITATPGLLLAVQTADCVPILLADKRRRVVAAVHSGWRGTLRRIGAKTVGRMRQEFGSEPGDIAAVLGPAIGKCCYEVGREVAREFESQFARAGEWFEGPYGNLSVTEEPIDLPWLTMIPPGHQPPPVTVRLDLQAANRHILEEAGISPKRIFSISLCTACHGDLLFSYRREHVTGRMMAVIGLRNSS
jgi:YfiH family protein